MPPTEYAARQPAAVKSEPPVTVLVTGFGPFLEKFPINSSWEIASTLPALIPASPRVKAPIQIRVHYEAIRVAYNEVIELVPRLLPPGNPSYPQPDIIVHIGLAAGRNYFALEQGSSRNGYGKTLDVDGDRFPDTLSSSKFLEANFPPILTTSFDTSDVLARWKTHLGYSSPDGEPETEGCPDVRISPNAGNFMCGFIYYNSLAHYYSIKEDERPVVFLHVPDLSKSEERKHEGSEVAIALIKALVESRQKVGIVDVRRQERDGNGETVEVQTDNNFV